ncbi:MAG: hypothetical protein N4A54_01370 [Peptostreptococcaceae bacterium]|jgi:hypothetical protein|nr:hypothetical protein [Peptostreptococcaceae bacterium]
MSILKFDDISIETPYKLISIIDINLNHGVLIHSTLEIEAICEEESFDSFFKTTLNDSIIIKKEDKIIFKGLIGSYDANKEGDVYSVYIKAVSATSLLDSKVESKSFQDTTMTYSSVIDEVIKDIRDSSVSFNVANKEIKEPLIMYNETAWEFVNRLASHFNTVLVADIKDNKPRFYFGFKDKNIIEIEDSKFYKSSKDLQSLNLSTQKLIDTDFFSHEIKSKEVYELQDKVRFKNKTLYISHIKGEFIKSELIFTYKLSRINGIRQNKIYNENIKGVSLEGKVIDSKEEFVKLHLNIDKKQDVKKAHWFRVGAISNNVFYLMFEKNTYARLYFPSNKEVLAEVKNSVRKNGSTCPLTKKPENRYLTTKDKNQISLKPKSIEFKSNEGLDLSILMEDKKGTLFKSNSQINLNSKANISLNAKNKVNIKASEFVLIYNHDKIKPQSLTIENEFHFIGDKINLEGTDRTAFKMYNDDPKLIPIKERKPKKLLTNPMKASTLASAPNNLLACANSNQFAPSGGANGAKGGNTPAKTNASKAGAKSGSASNKFSGKFVLGAMLVAAAPIVGVVAGPIAMVGMIAMGCALMSSPKKSLPKPLAPKKLNLSASGKKEERYNSSMDEQTDEELWEEFLILKYGLFSGAVRNGNLGRLKHEEILAELEKRLKEKTIEENKYKPFMDPKEVMDRFQAKLEMKSTSKEEVEENNSWNTPIFDLMGGYLKDVSKRNIEDIQNGNMSYIERVTKEGINGKENDSNYYIKDYDDSLAKYKLKQLIEEKINNPSESINLTGIGTNNNPDNDDEFLTMNALESTLTKYDIGVGGRGAIVDTSLKVIDLDFFDEFIEVDCTFDNQFMVAEGGVGADRNKKGADVALGGYASVYEGGISPGIKIGKFGIRGRGYALGGGVGTYGRIKYRYMDSDGCYHFINGEGVLEAICGAKINIDIYWEE